MCQHKSLQVDLTNNEKNIQINIYFIQCEFTEIFIKYKTFILTINSNLENNCEKQSSCDV